jgi:multiple sugar transport system permease protein
MKAAVSAPRPGHGRDRASVVAAGCVLVVFAVYFLVPLWWLAVAASKQQGALATTNGLWFSGFHLLENVRALFAYDNGIFARWLLNSLGYAGAGAAVATLLSAMTGYYLAKFTFRGRQFLLSVVLGAVMVPAAALALPLFLLVAHLGLADTYWAVFLPSVVSPFGVYIAYIFATSSVPDSIVEAARIDGAGEFRLFFSMALRLMSSGVVTIFLFAFVGIWNNFFLPLVMLQDSNKYPVTVGLYFWNNQSHTHPEVQGLTVIGSVVAVLPLMIAFLVLQRYWRSGLTAGALSG